MDKNNGSANRLVAPFNGTVQTTFLGFNRLNLSDYVLDEATIARREIVQIRGDKLLFNLTNCDRADRSTTALFHYSCFVLLCLWAFSFELSMFTPFWRLTKLRGPAFYILLNMLLCSSANILLFDLVLYVEAIVGHRLPIPLDLDYWLKVLPGKGETVFYFLYTINRSACIFFTFSYKSMFSKRKIFWLIVFCWFYTVLDRSEWLLANKGLNRAHCLAKLDDEIQTWSIIKDPWMVTVEQISSYCYDFIWYGPVALDIVTLAKLIWDKYKKSTVLPFFVSRPSQGDIDGVSLCQIERIRLFIVCFLTTTYHFLFAYFLSGWTKNALLSNMTLYNFAYILENVMPYALMMAISWDVRAEWMDRNREFCKKFPIYLIKVFKFI